MSESSHPLGLTPFDAAAYLTDEATIAEFLNAATKMGDPQVLLDAFAAVARARGMSELARKAGLGRESLYKALAPGAHPRYETIFKVAQALGVEMTFKAVQPARKVAPKPAPRVTSAKAAKPRKPVGRARGGERATARGG